VYCSTHPPSSYIRKYGSQLLPGWDLPIASVLIVIQPCPAEFVERTPENEQFKSELRDRFLTVGCEIARELQKLGYLADLFDPRSGLPIMSPAGQRRLDDVAVVQSVLGYETSDRSGCCVLVHPTLGTAIYPSTLASSALPAALKLVVDKILINSGLSI